MTAPNITFRRRAVFSGRVQGVGFRATCRQIAGRYPISGWVRNDAEGSVTLEIQGSENHLSAFFADLNRVMSRHIEFQQHCVLPVEAAEQGFAIRR